MSVDQISKNLKSYFSALGALQAPHLFSTRVEWQVGRLIRKSMKQFEIYFDASTRQVEPTPGAIMELSTGVVFMLNWLLQEFFEFLHALCCSLYVGD